MRRGLVVLVLLGAAATPAAADQNDLVLSRLATKVTANDGTVSYVGQNLELRELTSQLGVVIAPHLLTPADTVGFGGFQLTVDYATTTIDAGAPYWRARNGGTDDTMRTVGLFMRKGMWFPLPSFE